MVGVGNDRLCDLQSITLIAQAGLKWQPRHLLSISSSFFSSLRPQQQPTTNQPAFSTFPMDIHRYVWRPERLDQSSEGLYRCFFQHCPLLLKEEFHDAAAELVGGPVSPTLTQSRHSYTVATRAGAPWPMVVQFRRFELNTELMDLARQTYGDDLVPDCQLRGMFGETYVYRAGLVPGISFRRAQRRFFTPGNEDACSRR